jgi:hypothetical protein
MEYSVPTVELLACVQPADFMYCMHLFRICRYAVESMEVSANRKEIILTSGNALQVEAHSKKLGCHD